MNLTDDPADFFSFFFSVRSRKMLLMMVQCLSRDFSVIRMKKSLWIFSVSCRWDYWREQTEERCERIFLGAATDNSATMKYSPFPIILTLKKVIDFPSLGNELESTECFSLNILLFINDKHDFHHLAVCSVLQKASQHFALSRMRAVKTTKNMFTDFILAFHSPSQWKREPCSAPHLMEFELISTFYHTPDLEDFRVCLIKKTEQKKLSTTFLTLQGGLFYLWKGEIYLKALIA